MRINIVETDLHCGDVSTRNSTARLILHHVGVTNRDFSAADIHRIHVEDSGYSCIGYHFVIRKDGTVERGRGEDYVGAHAYGANSNSLGINVVGDFMNFSPTEAQIDSLVLLLADLCEKYDISPSDVYGHRDTYATLCPGENLYALIPEIKAKVREKLNETI